MSSTSSPPPAGSATRSKASSPDRVHVLFADGEVWALSPDMPIDALKPFLTISTAKSADREQLLSAYRVGNE